MLAKRGRLRGQRRGNLFLQRLSLQASKGPGRTDYQRGIYSIENGQFVVETTGNQSSGAFRSMSMQTAVVLEREREDKSVKLIETVSDSTV